MSNEIKNITDNIMEQIHNDKIKMRPRVYFVIGSVLTFVGLISSLVVSVFFLGLMRALFFQSLSCQICLIALTKERIAHYHIS